MSIPLDLRFTDPGAPLYIDVEGDGAEVLFVISTSHVPGSYSTVQRSSQAVNSKKRELEHPTNETPRFKKPMKAAQPLAPETAISRAASTSRSQTYNDSASMPPPGLPRLEDPPDGRGHARKEPLFLPSSQMSVADEEALRSIGLGGDSMGVNELADLLEGEGEEVDFSYMSQQPANLSGNQVQNQDCLNEDVQMDGPDSFELDIELPATQRPDTSEKVQLGGLFLDVTS